MDNPNQDILANSEQSDKTQGDNSKTNKKNIEETDINKSNNNVKVGGEDNKVVTVGGNLSGNVVMNNHIHYHYDTVEQKFSEKKLRADIDKRKKEQRNNRVSKPKGKKEEEWFESLDEYGKNYIVAVCFYYGMKVSDFREALNVIKNYLSTNAKTAFSYQHPSINVVEKYDIERLAVTVKFPDDGFVDRIFRLLQEKYTYLLFNFVPILKEIVEVHPENWEIRWRSAIALGQISEIDVSHVYNTVINNWAKDERAYVRATIGYYYYYILSADELFPEGPRRFLLDKLEVWASPKNFKDELWRLKWTVAAACEKIGLLENEQAMLLANQYIEKVAGINHIRVADSVVHALIEWSMKQKFPQVFKLLVSWAESGSAGDQSEDNPYEIRCIVALLALSAIVEINYDLLDEKKDRQEYIVPVDVLRTIWEKQSDDENYWNGLISIGVRYFDFKMGHYFFDMLETWVKIVPDKEFLTEFVSTWLKGIYFSLRSKIHLENRLKNVWAKSKNKILPTIAQLTQEKIRKEFKGLGGLNE